MNIDSTLQRNATIALVAFLSTSAFSCYAAGVGQAAKESQNSEVIPQYIGQEWPRAQSALELLKFLRSPVSGYAQSIHRFSKGRENRVCRQLLSGLFTGNFEEIQPVLMTDDPGHPALASYRKGCAAESNRIPVADYLTEIIGQYNYRKYRIPLDGSGDKRERDFLCADVDPALAQNQSGPGCAFYDSSTCTNARHRGGGGTGIGSSVGVPTIPSAIQRMFSSKHPYGFSVVKINSRYFILTIDKAPDTTEGEYWHFEVKNLSLDPYLSCWGNYTNNDRKQ